MHSLHNPCLHGQLGEGCMRGKCICTHIMAAKASTSSDSQSWPCLQLLLWAVFASAFNLISFEYVIKNTLICVILLCDWFSSVRVCVSLASCLWLQQIVTQEIQIQIELWKTTCDFSTIDHVTLGVGYLCLIASGYILHCSYCGGSSIGHNTNTTLRTFIHWVKLSVVSCHLSTTDLFQIWGLESLCMIINPYFCQWRQPDIWSCMIGFLLLDCETATYFWTVFHFKQLIACCQSTFKTYVLTEAKHNHALWCKGLHALDSSWPQFSKFLLAFIEFATEWHSDLSAHIYRHLLFFV